MAIIFPGKSTCAICGKVLMEEDEITGLPAASLKDNPLHRFFDEGFHKSCFDNWDKKKEVLAIADKQRIEWENSDEYKALLATYGTSK